MLMAGLAGLGAAETAYLTFVKLFGAPLVCPTSGCETVLSSYYSSLFGVPLSLYGMVAYGAVAAIAVSCAVRAKAPGAEGDTALRNLDEALLGGTTLLASCSGVLLYLLTTQFAGEPCAWCYASAGISLSLLGTALASHTTRQLQAAAAPSLGVLATTIVVLSLGFGGLGSSQANEDFELPYSPPEVTTESSPEAVSLAKRLREAGAKMYGAFWCSHCFDQKQTFGKAAMAEFPYVECYPSGWKRGAELDGKCDAAGVRAFPTWVINGKLIEGDLSLERLEAALTDKAVAQ